MKLFTRRELFTMCAALPLSAKIAAAGIWIPNAQTIEAPTPGHGFDWSQAVIESTMHRKPDPATLGGCGYAISLYLYGQYLVYLRTRNKQYLDYIQGWVDHNVNAAGEINRPRNTHHFHGIGSFLIMNEQLRRKSA